MATTEPAQQPHDRADKQGRRRPFSTWMKKLASFKGGSSTDASPTANWKEKRNTYQMKSNAKKAAKSNNPYPESGTVNGNSVAPANGQRSFSTAPTRTSQSDSSLNQSRPSLNDRPLTGNKSNAATMNTDVAHSDAAPSHTASSGEGANTMGGGMSNGRGVDSTFSSPAPSVRSLTTTLTTIHSAAAPVSTSDGTPTGNGQTIQFSHQFPTSPPPNALPPHLAPHGSGGHPATYNTATANNLLTDNASILTLASSSKRRRRRSMDTDASVRALAPSSLFGGSRESLPLSVLSASVEPTYVSSAIQSRANVGAFNERGSIYSASGVAPALTSERNSYYAGKPSAAADGGSIKSGLLGHGKTDSISGSIGGVAAPSSPLGPRDAIARAPSIGGLSRTNSAWEENAENDHPAAPALEAQPQ